MRPNRSIRPYAFAASTGTAPCRPSLSALVLLGLGAAGIACAPGDEPADAQAIESVEAPAEDGTDEVVRQPIDPATTGSIRGIVRVEGEYPRRELTLSRTPGCSEHGTGDPLSDFVVASDGKLANAFVWIKSGLEAWEAPAPPEEPVVLDQRGCMYAPHVVGVQTGQKLVVKNSDPATHNVNAAAKRNQRRNKSQSKGSADLEWVYEKPEIMIKFACDIHPWMSAWIGVAPHPFFAVTDENGGFTIPGLPPGTYEIEVVHENRDFGKRGKLRQSVEVRSGEATEVAFQMD